MRCPNCNAELVPGEAFFKKAGSDLMAFGLGSEDLRMKSEGGEVTYGLDGSSGAAEWRPRRSPGMLQLVGNRPILAWAATDSIGSIRVLQKCGIRIVGTNRDFANGRGEDTEEYILRLDPD